MWSDRPAFETPGNGRGIAGDGGVSDLWNDTNGNGESGGSSPATRIAQQGPRGGPRARHGRSVQGDLLAGVAHPGPQVAAVQGRQPLAGDEAEPEEGGQPRVGGVG